MSFGRLHLLPADRQHCEESSTEQQTTYVDDVDVWIAVAAPVRAVDAVMLQPLNMWLSSAVNTTLEHDCLTDFHRRIARSLADDRLVRVHSYTKILTIIIIHWRI